MQVGRTLQDTLALELIGAAPSLEQLLELGAVGRGLGLKVVALVDDTALLCRGGRDEVGHGLVGLLVRLTSDIGSRGERGAARRLRLRREVLGRLRVQRLLSGIDGSVGGVGSGVGGFVEEVCQGGSQG